MHIHTHACLPAAGSAEQSAGRACVAVQLLSRTPKLHGCKQLHGCAGAALLAAKCCRLLACRHVYVDACICICICICIYIPLTSFR